MITNKKQLDEAIEQLYKEADAKVTDEYIISKVPRIPELSASIGETTYFNDEEKDIPIAEWERILTTAKESGATHIHWYGSAYEGAVEEISFEATIIDVEGDESYNKRLKEYRHKHVLHLIENQSRNLQAELREYETYVRIKNKLA